MASTTFIDQQTIIYASWLNDVNNAVYNGIFAAPTITPDNIVCNGTVSGTGFTSLVSNVFASPNPIGNVTPNTGAFTTLTSTVGIAVSSGGTGAKTFTANSLLLGNGTSPFQTVAPGTSGNVLTSNGTTWTSAAPSGSGIAKAWVSFDGSGTILKAFNVSSVSRTSTGQYTVNFTTPMADANYVTLVTPQTTNNSTIRAIGYVQNGGVSTGSVGVTAHNLGAYFDPTAMYVVIFD